MAIILGRATTCPNYLGSTTCAAGPGPQLQALTQVKLDFDIVSAENTPG